MAMIVYMDGGGGTAGEELMRVSSPEGGERTRSEKTARNSPLGCVVRSQGPMPGQC
jgi:hypothetical protein